MNTEKLIVRFRNDLDMLERHARNNLGPDNKEFFKTVGKMELITDLITEISNGEWDGEE